ncbi:Probable RNA-directed DNA polymerase from transposon BS [Eumeta japonica]|uniref:Probable RNA-directed DNA polymerase from transposon BS n=1 Tax=Eumeta variegata TaxID=151549 RepID=A0A4C1YTG3_EUMVA|nr:Probable RNA-directed DNA polymerase from transposon BS [Eumeta japonica]
MHPNGKAHGGSAILIKSTIKHYQSQPHCKDYIQATNVVVSAGRFIAAGDYNAKHTFWGSRLTLPRGRELLKSAQSGHMNIISTGQPTYWPTDKDKIPDIVDFCIFKGIANTNISCSSCWDLSSDHSPILVEITAEIRETTRRCTLHNKRTNWPLFRALTDEAFSVPIALQTKETLWMLLNILLPVSKVQHGIQHQ